MKKIQKLKGVESLSKEELKSVNGGLARPCAGYTNWVEIPLGQTSCENQVGTQWINNRCYACYNA